MITSRFVRYLAVILTTTLALGCADSPLAPADQNTSAASSSLSAPSQANELLGLLDATLNPLLETVTAVLDPNGISVTPVRWSSRQTVAVRSVTGTIGYWGGTLSIPGSGFSIRFPIGALSTNRQITITSDASGYVSYDMQPHGLRFAKPVVVTQHLRNTEAYDNPVAGRLFGAYFPDEDPLSRLVGGLLDAVEIVHSVTLVRPDDAALVQTWLINHFSRYMLASG
jgi:hypothetical protein